MNDCVVLNEITELSRDVVKLRIITTVGKYNILFSVAVSSNRCHLICDNCVKDLRKESKAVHVLCTTAVHGHKYIQTSHLCR